eukprot:TRINITY_DN69981_c0_g1_i1.p1 TRINITY_DN69981_c0_g1~~TRINITY_DN69981_c0_g1_i1.p1  ORF type:complete len:689 (+),score=231.96 TRINITY_DN69981_c0_g1_i1:75-2069(+)
MASRRTASVHILPQGAAEGPRDPFEERSVVLDLQKDTATTVLEKCDVKRGLLCSCGRILDDGAAAKQWFDPQEPLVGVAVRHDYIESDESRQRHPAARLIDAGVHASHALRALGRATWYPGFTDFARSALEARRLVDRTGQENHARVRMLVSMDTFGGLGEVAPFRENRQGGESLMLPPCSAGHLAPPQVRGVWRPEFSYAALSAEERRDLRRRGRLRHERRPHLERASRAVVRVFGFHPFDDPAVAAARAGAAAGDADPEGTFEQLMVDSSEDRFDVVPFTAFFVAPRLLLCTRACAYGDRQASYASHYMFTARAHAQLGALQLGQDLWRCKEVRGVTEFVAKKMRAMGFELPDDKIPPGNLVVPWNDLMLLEVDAEQASPAYLLPEIDPVHKGQDVASVGYHYRPDDAYVADVFGPRGHSVPTIGERAISDVFWGYERKTASFGEALRDGSVDGTVSHSCSLLPGSLGGPLLSRFEPRELPAAPGGEPTQMYTFSGVNCGRTVAEIDDKISQIEANSTSEHAAKVAKSLNVNNDATTVRHLVFTLVYQHFVAPLFKGRPEGAYIEELLAPYKMFAQPELLAICHRKMLMDAEDCSEWGQDFMDRYDVDSALSCFREGARMFSIATIPDISESERRLKDALQANVSAVVMARKESGGGSWMDI